MKKFWKPALSMILVLGCTVSIASATVTPVQSDDLLQPYGAATQFQDVPSNAWFYNDISKAVDMGWMKGTSATTFKPNDKLTNAQILQIISNLGAEDASDQRRDYLDLPANAWYYDIAVKYGAYLMEHWNKYKGGAQLFPDEPITRLEFSYAMLRCSGLSDSDIGDIYYELTGASRGSLGGHQYPEAALIIINEMGVISGYPNGDLGEYDPLTRAQCATMLNRLYQLSEDTDEQPQDTSLYSARVISPDGIGVNLRSGPDSSYSKVRENPIPVGTEIAITKEMVSAKGSLWGYTQYEGSEGWVYLAEVKQIQKNATEAFNVTDDAKASNQISAMENRIKQENVFASRIDMQNKIFTRENWRVYEEILLESLADRKWYNMRAIGTYVGKNPLTSVDMYDVKQSDFESWMNYYYGADAATPPAAGLYQNGVYRTLNSQGFIGDTIHITAIYSLGDGKYYVEFNKIHETESIDDGSGYAVLHWANDHYQVYELGWNAPEISDERFAYHLAS